MTPHSSSQLSPGPDGQPPRPGVPPPMPPHHDLPTAGFGPPPAPRGAGGRGKTVWWGIAAVVAAAAVIGGATVVMTGGDDDGPRTEATDEGSPNADTDAQPDADADPDADPAENDPGEPEEPDAGGGPDDPRGGVEGTPDPVAGDDWQPMVHESSEVAYDFPPEWVVRSSSYAWVLGEENAAEDEEPALLVGVLGAGAFQENWCSGNPSPRSFAGVRTSSDMGVTSEDASLAEAEQWAFAAYNQSGEATEEYTDPEPFTTEHGLEGHIATAEVTGVPEGDCSADGKVTVVSFVTPSGELASWVHVSDTGFDDEPDQESIDLMASTLRPAWD